jgi:hypothetical protein
MTRQKIKGKSKLCTLYSSQQKNDRTVPVTCISSSSVILDESLSRIERMKDQLEVTATISPDVSTMTSMVLRQCEALLVSSYLCPLKDIPKTSKMNCSSLSPLREMIVPDDDSIVMMCEGDETSFEGKCFFFTEVPCL